MLTETLLGIPFPVIGDVLKCQPPMGKCARINLSQVASSLILQNHRRLPVSVFSVKIATLGSLKLLSNFKGASYNFDFAFHQLGNKNCKKNYLTMYST
jgi:hypothetical protein